MRRTGHRRLAAMLVAAAGLISVLAGPAAPALGAGVCATPPAYPGDAATKADLAQWLARSARARGLPGELPVMGALVASGLTNLQTGPDETGYFGMRASIWNAGAYAGFATQPVLQASWFADQAIPAGAKRAAKGVDLTDSAHWGEWVADVLRPPEQDRGRYATKLAQAQTLVACSEPAPGLGTGVPPATTPTTEAAAPTVPTAPVPAGDPPPTVALPAADTAAPTLTLSGSAARQRAAHRRAVVVSAQCGNEACTAAATSTLTLKFAGTTRRFRLRAAEQRLAAGQTAALQLPLTKPARTAVRRALAQRRRVQVSVEVTVSDAAGNRAVQRHSVRLTG